MRAATFGAGALTGGATGELRADSFQNEFGRSSPAGSLGAGLAVRAAGQAVTA